MSNNITHTVVFKNYKKLAPNYSYLDDNFVLNLDDLLFETTVAYQYFYTKKNFIINVVDKKVREQYLQIPLSAELNHPYYNFY